MPAMDQSVLRHVGRHESNISTPSSMAFMISILPASNAAWRVGVHSNFSFGLRKGLNGSSVLSWPYPATWLIRPNQDLMSVRF